MHRHVLVLGDQLTRQVGPLAGADPERTSVLMVESEELARSLPHHRQKLVLCFSAMRHFAAELEADGFGVHYKRAAASFDDGIGAYLRQFRGVTLTVMEPNDHGWAERLTEAVERHGGDLEIVPNELWLTSKELFDGWANDRDRVRLEHFYRRVRTEFGLLMTEDGDPEGGRWNFDRLNRETPDDEHVFPDPPAFPPDALTQEVAAYVSDAFPDAFGDVGTFAWPVTRDQALDALRDFCENRLRHFGPFEDAMLADEPVLYHSQLSVPLNLGLLHPREVVEMAIEHYRDGRRNIPLQSIEGFVRQVIGWREFLRHVYRRRMPSLRAMNALEHDAELPDLYWTGDTRMHCLATCVDQVRRTGWAHHIQRLMVLGTFGLIAGVRPQALLDWFTAAFVDALDWVMVPNVIGMSQYADGGGFTTKPYAASANYVDKMSDYCRSCSYDRNAKVGADACPFNSLYWDFLDRHQERLDGNPRMNMVLASWKRMDDDRKDAIRQRAADVKARLAAGEV